MTTTLAFLLKPFSSNSAYM